MVLPMRTIIAEGDAMTINRSYTTISLFETRKYTFLERSLAHINTIHILSLALLPQKILPIISLF